MCSNTQINLKTHDLNPFGFRTSDISFGSAIMFEFVNPNYFAHM